MRVADWRHEPADRIGPRLDRECGRWRDSLGWHLEQSWTSIEPARRAGSLAGLVADDADGRALGWAFFLNHRDTLHIGALIAESREATAALVEAALASPSAAAATRAIAFVREDAPGLREELDGRGFATARYRYLSTFLDGREAPLAASAEPIRAGFESPPGAPIDARPDAARHAALETPGRTPANLKISDWSPADLPAIVTLVQAAYRSSTELRPFAPDGRRDQWVEYVAQILQGPGCGAFLPWASAVVRDPGTARPIGVILTTAIDDHTAHVAQVAVDPEVRRAGVGRLLVRAARDAVRARGFTRMTLFVSEDNVKAGRLYEALGFETAAWFLAAKR